MHIDRPVSGQPVTNDQASGSNLLMTQSLEEALSEDLATIPQVRHVLTGRADNTLLVWIAVDDPRPEVRHKIYQKELELLNGFPETDFDFNLIPSHGRSAAEIASGVKVVYSRQE